MSKKGNIQSNSRKKTFTTSQYWNINYTEYLPTGEETDYKLFIKAYSYDQAKYFLRKRLEEQDPPAKAKALHGFIFHKNYKNAYNVKLGVAEWEQIRSASFPNANNILYKLEIPRDPKKTNRFNSTDLEHIKKIGFKSGKDNWSHIHRKGVIRPISERKGMIYKGTWKKWDKALMDVTRKSLIQALTLHGGNRSKAAIHLNVSRHKFYNLMAKFPEIDWAKDYPVIRGAPPPIPTEQRSAIGKEQMKKRMEQGHRPFNLSPEARDKQLVNMKKTKKAQQEKRWNKLIPKVKDALDRHSNCRSKSADYLGMGRSALTKFLRKTKHIVDWPKLYPSKFGRGKYFKRLFETDHLDTPTVKKLNERNGL